MKYQNGPLVKEQMKYEPTPGARQTGNTSNKKHWIDFVQRDGVESDIGYRAEHQNAAELEMYEQPGTTKSLDEDAILRRNLGTARPTHMQRTNTISVDPRRDNTEAFVDYAQVNHKYDQTVDREVLHAGYLLKDLSALEQDYTGQHFTGFYTELSREDKETGKTVTGFLYRNNYLNRI